MARSIEPLADLAAEAERMHAQFCDLQKRIEAHLLGANCADARAHLMSASAYCHGGALLARGVGAAATCADAAQMKDRATRDPKCGHPLAPLTPKQIEELTRP